MPQDRDGPQGEFKRVLTLAMKTLASEPELEVAYGAETPSLQGKKAKLPQVSTELTSGEVAVTRGLADSFAMRLSNHNDKVHSHYRPECKNARAVYEAVEQARVEALGALAMPGMDMTSSRTQLPASAFLMRISLFLGGFGPRGFRWNCQSV